MAAIAYAFDSNQVDSESTTSTLLNLGHWLIVILYYTIGVSVYSTTVGKRVLGLYVLRPDGSKLGPGRALARYFATILSGLVLFIGYLMIAFSDNKRGLHDEICDTVVVRNR